MTISYSHKLEAKVDKAEQKTDQIKQSKDIERELSSVTGSIHLLNNKYNDIEELAQELNFYVGVLEEVFNGSRTNCAGLERAIRQANHYVDIEDEAVLNAANQGTFAELHTKLDNAKRHISNAIGMVDKHTKEEFVEKYQNELKSAKELNSIIGGENDDFVVHIDKMQTFLTEDIKKTDRSVLSLSNRWDRLTSEWERHSEKQGWETFQRKYRLSNVTVRELKQFTGNKPVKLSDLSIKSIKEIKEVNELESALQVELRSQ